MKKLHRNFNHKMVLLKIMECQRFGDVSRVSREGIFSESKLFTRVQIEKLVPTMFHKNQNTIKDLKFR